MGTRGNGGSGGKPRGKGQVSGYKRNAAGRILSDSCSEGEAYGGRSSGSHGGSTASIGGGGASSKPKKRFIWPDELHRDFIAAVLDVGLKSADEETLAGMLPRKDGVSAVTMKSALQKMRSFRYQMRKAAGGDNLHTLEEMAERGVDPQQALLLQSAVALTRLSGGGAGRGGGDGGGSGGGRAAGAFLRLPDKVQRVVERLDSEQIKRNVELVAQCVQVQCSLQLVLKNAVEKQRKLQRLILEKVASLGLPYPNSGTPGFEDNGAAPFGEPAWMRASAGKMAPPVKSEPEYASPRSGASTIGVAGLAAAAAVAALDSPFRNAAAAAAVAAAASGHNGSAILNSPGGIFGSAAAAAGGAYPASGLPLALAAETRSPGGIFGAVGLAGGGASCSGGERSIPARSLEAAALDGSGFMGDGGDGGAASSGEGGLGLELGLERASSGSETPTETVLKLEMQSHMDLHRQMVLRQQDQLQLHAALHAARRAAAAGAAAGEGGGSRDAAGASVPVSASAASAVGPAAGADDAGALAAAGAAGSSAAAAAAGELPLAGVLDGGMGDWTWDNDDILDQQLFNFLNADPKH